MKTSFSFLFVSILVIVMIGCGDQSPDQSSSQRAQSPAARCEEIRQRGASNWAAQLKQIPSEFWSTLSFSSQASARSSLERFLSSVRSGAAAGGVSSGVQGISVPPLYRCPDSGAVFSIRVTSSSVVLTCPNHGGSTAYF